MVACWMSLAAVGEASGPQHNRIIALQQPELAPEPTPGPKLRDIELKLRRLSDHAGPCLDNLGLG